MQLQKLGSSDSMKYITYMCAYAHIFVDVISSHIFDPVLILKM